MKRTPLLMSIAGLLIALFMVTQTALAHKDNVNLTVSFNPNPAPAGSSATITATLTFAGTQGPGSATGHPAHDHSNGTAVVGQKIHIQEWMIGGVGAACGTAGGAWVRIDGAGAGLATNSSGQASMSFNTTGLAGQTIGFRAHHPAEGGSHGTEQKQSDCANLEIANLVSMPVNKLVNGQAAACTPGPDLRSPANGGTGNPDFHRPCLYPNGLSLDDSDPRFDINVYTTVNGLPGTTLIGGLPFPQPGPRVAPQFHPSIQAGTALTFCEAPDTISSPRYQLTGATITHRNGAAVVNTFQASIYFHQGYACFNTVIPASGVTEVQTDLNNAQVCTYTQGYYGNAGSRAGGKLYENFGSVYNNSTKWLQVGDRNPLGTLDDNSDGWSMLFTSAAGVNGYLPAGGTAGPLNNNYTNPVSATPPVNVNGSGVFGGQVLTLQLNVDLGNANVFGGIGNYLVFTGAGQCGNGKTVSEILTDANLGLSGLASSCTIPQLNNLTTRLNESFDNCVAHADASLFTAPTPGQ